MKLNLMKTIGVGHIVFAFVTLFVSAQVVAAEPIQCKGLNNEACVTNESCSWVNGYERKDGRTVEAFCRSKANSKATSQSPSEAKEKST